MMKLHIHREEVMARRLLRALVVVLVLMFLLLLGFSSASADEPALWESRSGFMDAVNEAAAETAAGMVEKEKLALADEPAPAASPSRKNDDEPSEWIGALVAFGPLAAILIANSF